METKVREATNNEPWGASTRLMAQIAAGTYNYREREEILSFIFRRFTEKAANEWRQIYKSLQLLEYIVRNGSERVIDEIRSNISLIQMLKSFHYIDSKGRDQGINVRNRSKNLVNLLNDDSLIRSERKKSARQNQKTFGGIAGGGASITAGSQYGGNDDDFNNRVYGDGGVFGARYDDPASVYDNGTSGGDNNFEEYNVEGTSSARASKATTSSSKVNAGSSLASKPKSKPEQPAQDLLGDLMSFDSTPSAPKGTSSQQPPQAAKDDDDDDFDDFQSAPLASNTNDLASNIASLYVSQPSTQQYGQPQPMSQPPSLSNFSTNTSTGPSKPSGDAFSSLFSSAKTKTSSTPKLSAPKSQAVHKEDDLFNDFTSNRETSQKTQPQPASASNSGDVDLLSF